MNIHDHAITFPTPVALVWREQPAWQLGSSVYVESVLLQKLILRSTGASLANRVGLIMTGAWLSPCTRAQHGTRHFAFSHFDRTLQVRLLWYDPFVKIPPATKWYLSLVEERAYMFDVPRERMSFGDKECGAVTSLRLHTTVVRSGWKSMNL